MPGGAALDLSSRGPIRRIFCALLEQRLKSPGTPVDSAELFEKGWPGERAVPDAVLNRVRVSIAPLRNMGLKDYIITYQRSYFLEPTRPIRVLETDSHST